MNRTIKEITKSVRDDIADLKTFRALPTPALERIDPFLFLNHHGHQIYPTQNSGLPFGPHPHRGFETVTFILKGDIAHRDSGGHESIIQAGGIQWMTAGSGLVHEEVSSEKFKEAGGELEILQLWINLPSHLKMTKPAYTGLQKNDLTTFSPSPGVDINLISGDFMGQQGPYKSLTSVTAMIITMAIQSKIEFSVPSGENIFCYIVNGELKINNKLAHRHDTVQFNQDGDVITFLAATNSQILLCYACPLKEPVVMYGPFVMNTMEEIQQAFKDYQSGKFTL